MDVKKKVLVGGVFDILHYGHIHFLKKAKALGNYLIVAIESDSRVKKLKGSARPFHNQKQRKEILESLEFVDEVIILKNQMEDSDYLGLVKKVKPSVIAITAGDPMTKKKSEHAYSIGAKIVRIPLIKNKSTSKIVELLNLE